uniref:hypothetical protein n=1 Tax=Streptococcus oralis TaxID=1303 RepID=UPI003BA9BBE3
GATAETKIVPAFIIFFFFSDSVRTWSATQTKGAFLVAFQDFRNKKLFVACFQPLKNFFISRSRSILKNSIFSASFSSSKPNQTKDLYFISFELNKYSREERTLLD